MLTLKEKIITAIPYLACVAVIAIAVFAAIPTTVEKGKKIWVVENQAHTERMEIMDAILQDLEEINQHLDELKSQSVKPLNK